MSVQIIKVFISSPGDLFPERAVIKQVIHDLNTRNRYRNRFKLDLYTWEDQTPALVGEPPQPVVDKYMIPPEKVDILLCMLWTRMGTPTKALIDPDTQKEYVSGTYSEFIRAYREFQRTKTAPHVRLYRCTRSKPLDQIDTEQFALVDGFFKRFERGGDLDGMYKTFDPHNVLERLVREDLENYLDALTSQGDSASPPPPPPIDLAPHIAPYLKWLTADIRRRVTHLFLDLQGDKQTLSQPERYRIYDDDDNPFVRRGVEAEADHVSANEGRKEYVPNVRERLRALDRAVLIGEPGSGKSWMLQRLAVDYAEAWLNADAGLTDQNRALVPVLVLLNKYNGGPFAEFVKESMDTLAPYHDRLLREGRLAVLCDALNEMPRAAGQLEALITYLKAMPTPRFIISCRVRDYKDELGDLKPLEQVLLRDLELPAIRELVVKRLGDQVGGALWKRMGGTPELMAFWEKMSQKQATDLFWEKNTAWWNNEQRLRERIWSEPDAWRTMHRDGARLIPLCRNPYMGHLLCTVYGESGDLPASRAELFGKFVERMLLRERNAAARLGQPFPENKAVTAALVAFARALQARKITVLPQVEAQKLVTDPALLRAATDANILAAEGDNLKFAHQLLQEYFAAKILLEAMEAKPQRSPAEFFGETWWDAGVWAETVVILGEFPGGRDSANRATQWLAPVTPEVALEVITRNAAGLTLDDLTPETKQVLIQGSCSVSDYDLKNLKWGTRKTDPRGRAAAWRVLGHLRADPRPGVLNFDWGEDYWRKAPAGPFIMGSDQDNDNPKREATIDYDFWIGKYPITWAQFKAFLDDPDGYEKDAWWAGLHPDALKHRNKNQIQRWKIANHPAEQVSWYDAMAFCAWLNGKVKPPLPDGAPADCRIRLPLETEWEKAAAWDAQRQKALVYPYGDAFDPLKGNTYEGRVGRTTAVGLYPHAPSPAGGLDMSGNIWEWCLNEYESGDENISFNQRRGVRGGAWGGGQVWARAAYRLNGYPDPRDVFLGFRVVVAVPVSH